MELLPIYRHFLPLLFERFEGWNITFYALQSLLSGHLGAATNNF